MAFNIISPRALVTLLLTIVPLGCLFPAKLNRPGRLEALTESGKFGTEVLKIYSLIKLNRADLAEEPAWKIAKTIARESRNNSLDPMLVVAVIDVESRFRVEAVSERGARGLMQVRPEAALEVAQNTGFEVAARDLDPDLLHEPTINIKIGVSYLGYLQKKFKDLNLALTAYNWGPTKTQKSLDEQAEVPQDYALKVLAAYHAYRGKKFPPTPWKAA
ncbi:MAG: lytic transglycosylase domain-containing protein [Candidatus Binatia bacterium]